MVVLCSCSTSNYIAPTLPGDSQEETLITFAYRQQRSTKRGVAFNHIEVSELKAIESGVGWLYNWGSQYSPSLEEAMTSTDIDYVPMAWNGSFNTDHIRAYKALHPKAQYILAFNEPNLTDQANMTPAQAALHWPALKSVAQELGLSIVAPAMNWGTLTGYSDPIDWLDEFFTLVPLSDVAAIAVHCYMNWPSAVKWHIERFRKYGKPVWVTEFCAWEGKNLTVEAQRTYMCEVVNYFENDPLIERYAWFMFDGTPAQYPYYALSSGGKLTDLGTIYLNLSSHDTDLWYRVGEAIPAQHYCRTNQYNVVGTDRWEDGVMLKVCSDHSGTLEVSGFSAPKWLEYQIEVPETATYTLAIRYAATSLAYCTVKLNNRILKTAILLGSGTPAKWMTHTGAIDLPAGQHTLRLEMDMGEIAMNWCKLE